MEVGEVYGDDAFVEEMEKFKGKIVTIAEKYEDYYRIEEDFEPWCYTDEMLEPIEPTESTESTESSLGEKIGNLYDNMLNTLKENPAMMLEEMQKIIKRKDERIEELELELKTEKDNKYYLAGKVDAYEYIIKNTKEE